MSVAARDFSMVEQKLERNYIAVRKLIPFRTVTFDPEITAQSNWIGVPAVSIGASATDPTSFRVQSIVNVNIDGEYSVLPLNNEMVAGGIGYNIVERFRPDFHPRMPSSGAYMATIMARVTSDSAIKQFSFRPILVAYTRTGSMVAHFSGQALLLVGSDASLGVFRAFNQWQEASGTIQVNSNQFINPNSGPYFLAPGCRIGISPSGVNSQGALSSSWIAYLNITAGNP